MPELIHLEEPLLLFGHGQGVEDPRDGLTLFGPLDKDRPYGVRWGVVGTEEGIERLKGFVRRVKVPVGAPVPSAFRPPFPGFEAVFGIPWEPRPSVALVIPQDELSQAVHTDDAHQRVYRTVDSYAKRILKAKREEESPADLWFVVVPDEVYKYCRPRSFVEKALRVTGDRTLSAKSAKMYRETPSLFAGDNEAVKPYQYEVNFHNQLKARLLEENILTQIVRETTLDLDNLPRGKDAPSAIAWSLCTGVYYKVGGRPWKIGSIRDGVCYIGVVFKQDERGGDPRSACCAAQMFLDSGDGVVFKGNVGPWYSPDKGDFHLTRNAARQLMETAVSAYKDKMGKPPAELFIHGKVRFEHEEWKGFQAAVNLSETNLVGVRIRTDSYFKLYSNVSHPVLRCLAYVYDDRHGYLWTKGYTPRLQTYNGKEVPNPLMVEVCQGTADIRIVLQDILALTKLNYNTCVYADGEPVTLRFADAIGEILTAGPMRNQPPLPFRHYI